MIHPLRRICPVPLDVLLLLPFVVWCLHCAEGTTADPGGYPDIIDEPVLNYVADADGRQITSARMGETVWLVGERFKAEAKAFFGATEAPVASVSADGTRIETVVPQMANPGSVDVHVTVDGRVSNAIPFFVSLIPGGNLVNALDPRDVVLDEGRGRVFTANRTTDSVSVVDLAAPAEMAVRNLAVGQVPEVLTIDLSTGNVFVAGADSLTLIEPEEGFRVSVFPHEQIVKANAIALNPDQGVVYLVSPKTSNVPVFDVKTRQWVAVLPVGKGPTEIALDENLHTLYVTCADDGTVTSYQWPGYDKRTDLRVGVRPHAIGVDESRHRVYVTCLGEDSHTTPGSMAVIDGEVPEVIGHVPVGLSPLHVVVSSPLNKIFVANNGETSLGVVDGARIQLTGSIDVGKQPADMALDWTGRRLVLVNLNTTSHLPASLSLIDADREWVIARVPLGGDLTALAIDGAAESAYVADTTKEGLLIVTGLGTAKPGVEEHLLGIRPVSMALDHSSGSLIVGSLNGAVSVISPDISCVHTRLVGSSVLDVAIDGTGSRIFTADDKKNQIWALDATTLGDVASLWMPMAPQNLIFDPVHGKLFVFGVRSLTVVDSDTLEHRVRQFWDFQPSRPSQMVLCKKVGILYVSNHSGERNTEQVLAIDTASERIVQRIENPGRWKCLNRIVSDPDRDLVYVLDNGGWPDGNDDPNLTVLESATGRIIQTVPVGTYPTDAAVRDDDGTVFVSNYAEGTVTVINPQHEVAKTVLLESGVNFMVYDALSDILIVHNTLAATLLVLDGHDFAALSETPVGTQSGFVMHGSLLLDSHLHRVWVRDPDLGGMSVFSCQQLASGLAK